MKTDKENEFVDDNGNKDRIKHKNGSWHLVKNNKSVFSFSEKDAEDLVSLFKESI